MVEGQPGSHVWRMGASAGRATAAARMVLPLNATAGRSAARAALPTLAVLVLAGAAPAADRLEAPDPYGRRSAMITSDRAFTAATLRRAGLLAVMLAVIAGIFGLHVMSGSTSGYSPAALLSIGPASHTGTAGAGSHGLHPASGTSTIPLAGEVRNAAVINDAARIWEHARTCSDSGIGGHAMAGSCIPSVKTGSLSAPHPGTAGYGAASSARAAGAPGAGWSYYPGTPSPGELSISRT